MKKTMTMVFGLSLLFPLTAQISDTIYDLHEVVISASKFDQDKSQSAVEIISIPKKEIMLTNPMTTAELLSQSGKVFTQKSQLGGGSPVIRGFEANKILIVLDGVRMNNAIFRGGHLQNVLRVNSSQLQRAEILGGSSSLLYGSDAMGGVLNFRTLQAFYNADGFKANGDAMIRYSSAAFEKTASFNLNLGWKRFASLSSISFSDFDDLRQGASKNLFAQDSDANIWCRCYYVDRLNGGDSILKNSKPFIQKKSGYYQYNIMQKFAYSSSDYVKHELNFYASNSSDVYRYDRLTEGLPDNPAYAEWYYGPELWLRTTYNLHLSKANTVFDEANFSLSHQYFEESRHSRRFGSLKRRNQYEFLNTYQFNADFAKNTSEKNRVEYGMEASHDYVYSQANNINIADGSFSEAASRYPNKGSWVSRISLYTLDRYQLNEQISIRAGLRAGYSNLQSNLDTVYGFALPNSGSQNNLNVSGSAEFIYLPHPKHKLSALFSTAYREPNVDDLSKVFESTAGALIVPNWDLQAEKSRTIEFNSENDFNERIAINLNLYHTWLRDAIVTDAYSINGEDSVLFDGVYSQLRANQNKGRAFISGASAELSTALYRKLRFVATATYTYGRIVENSAHSPLDHIPPLFGKASLNWKEDSWGADLFLLFNAAKALNQYKLDGEDNLQYATATGTPAWMTLNAKGYVKIKERYTISGGCENIFDTNYRFFASGISAPGRNFILSAALRF